MKKFIQMARSETPPFFRKIRNLGLVLTALATTVLTAPISLPAIIVVTISGYIATARLAATYLTRHVERSRDTLMSSAAETPPPARVMSSEAQRSRDISPKKAPNPSP